MWAVGVSNYNCKSKLGFLVKEEKINLVIFWVLGYFLEWNESHCERNIVYRGIGIESL